MTKKTTTERKDRKQRATPSARRFHAMYICKFMLYIHQAQRLMEGYSSNSRRSSSAPSGQPSSGGATPTQDERSTLPVSLRIAVVRAKVHMYFEKELTLSD